MAHRFFSFLRRPSHSLSSPRSADASRFTLDFLRQEIQQLESVKRVSATPSESAVKQKEKEEEMERSVEIVHPWPEWVELIDHLLKRGFLDPGAFHSSSSSCNISKYSNHIRTACLSFSRESSELIRWAVFFRMDQFISKSQQQNLYANLTTRYLSRKDIRIIVGYGCPSLDRKVVNSGKRLRAYVGTNEGEVCSSCKLRGDCERAFEKANEDEAGRTLDVMRILLTYGLDAMTASVEKKSFPKQPVKESARKLLKDIVDLSVKNYDSQSNDRRSAMDSSFGTGRSQNSIPMKQGDWICPKCNFLNFAKNIKCLRCDGLFQERLAKLREDREHLPLKKGDWICEKCNFFNFAKNATCLQCNEKATNRMLNPGEWECASCNYINFRKNYFCLKCGWKRPKLASTGDDATRSHMNIKKQHISDMSPHFLQKKSHQKEDSSVYLGPPKYSFCVDNDVDEEDANIHELRRPTEFHEFPVVGGKSTISRDPLAMERWKKEMLLKNKGIAVQENTGGNCYQALASSSSENMALDESIDEDDIGGWFKK